MTKKRRQYDAQYKFRVALEAAKGNKTINELASETGVHPNQIGAWKRQLLENGAELFSRNGSNSAVRAEAIGLAEQFDDMGMVRESVEQGCGQTFIAKDLDPIGELEIGGDNQGQAFVERRAEGEQRLGANRREGDEAELIQHHQVELECGANQAMHAVLILGL